MAGGATEIQGMTAGVSGEVICCAKLCHCSRSGNSVVALQFMSLTWKLKSRRAIVKGEMEHSWALLSEK